MKLTLKDSKGVVINLGDWVKVTAEHYRMHFSFFVQVKIIDGNSLQPFENFCWDQIEKVDGPPEGAQVNKDGFYFLSGPSETIEELDKRRHAMQSRFFETAKEKFFCISE